MWLTGAALVLCVGMIVALLILLLINGATTFWPRPVLKIETKSGKKYLGEVSNTEAVPANDGASSGRSRRLFRIENFEFTDLHFAWFYDDEIASETKPDWAMVIERESGGVFFGEPVATVTSAVENQTEPTNVLTFLSEKHRPSRSQWEASVAIDRDELGRWNDLEEASRRKIGRATMDFGPGSPELAQAEANHAKFLEEATAKRAELDERKMKLRQSAEADSIVFETADGQRKTIPLRSIVRAYPANQLGLFSRLGIYFDRWREFLIDNPRNNNNEGGVFPAIWGTVAMTLIMSLVVAPFGVLAALYLREYAQPGPVVSAIRISINNLAGVPSIVFGTFGLGFFCYQLGSFVDGGPKALGIEPLPTARWWLMLLGLAIGAVMAFVLTAHAMSIRLAEQNWTHRVARWIGGILWIAATAAFLYLVFTSPFFNGFFYDRLPNPTFGKGGILWASLTLSLLTLPVVIVATEEALQAVPNSMREGSYACGAGKWQTIRRIVLPQALPGIMTGMILAMARGAGEVAPLMLVGALKSAPKLPIDGGFPFVHAERPFMHLAFHIFDLGFQSPNSEAAKPMVYTTAFLLVLIIGLLNLTAFWLRARLRKAYRLGQF